MTCHTQLVFRVSFRNSSIGSQNAKLSGLNRRQELIIHSATFGIKMDVKCIIFC